MNLKCISLSALYKIAFSFNLISVIWNIINDCDETYNYWEPLHFIIYGDGFQTWEYSPLYALRSYLYLVVNGWPAILLNWLIPSISKRLLFYVIRIYMAVITTWLEVHIYKSLKFYLNNNESSNMPLYSILMLIFSTGSFICSTAFLPSTFAFYCGIFTFSNWIKKDYNLTIASVALSTIIGWPFSVATGIPFAIDIVFFKRKVVYFIKTSLIWGFIFSTSSILFDSYFYGRLVFPCWNIVKYNIFNSHGSELYGVESWIFYVKNYLLNFNVAMIFVILYPLLFTYLIYCRKQSSDISIGFMAFSVFTLWNLIFFLQPHKEERFLFPCYPFLAILSGFCLYQLQQIFNSILKTLQSRLFFVKMIATDSLGILVILGFALISLSRIVAIVLSYNAPITLFSHLSDYSNADKKILCLGGEWHRFPSSFLDTASLNVSFIKSNFTGQLPAKFKSIQGISASRVTHNHFNDLNKEEMVRYVEVSQCDFIIDLIDQQVEYLKDYNLEGYTSIRWKPIIRYKMLSPFSVGGKVLIFRSFYIPGFFEQMNTFVDYALFEKEIL